MVIKNIIGAKTIASLKQAGTGLGIVSIANIGLNTLVWGHKPLAFTKKLDIAVQKAILPVHKQPFFKRPGQPSMTEMIRPIVPTPAHKKDFFKRPGQPSMMDMIRPLPPPPKPAVHLEPYFARPGQPSMMDMIKPLRSKKSIRVAPTPVKRKVFSGAFFGG